MAPRRIAQAVDDLRSKAVGDIDDRADAVSGLQTVGIQFGLLLPGLRIDGGLLGLDDGQGLSVGGIEDIIGVPNTALVGHPLQFHLDACLPGDDQVLLFHNLPAGLPNEQVDEQAAGFGLGVVISDDRCGGRVFHRLDGDGLDECAGRGRDFLPGRNLYFGSLVQQLPVKRGQRGEHAEFQQDSADEIVQVEDAEIGLTAGNSSGMGGQIADFPDIVGGHHEAVVADEGRERFAGHELIELGPLGNPDVLERVDRSDHPLQAPAAVERAAILVRIDHGLRSLAEAVQVAELLYVLEVVKVSHISGLPHNQYDNETPYDKAPGGDLLGILVS